MSNVRPSKQFSVYLRGDTIALLARLQGHGEYGPTARSKVISRLIWDAARARGWAPPLSADPTIAPSEPAAVTSQGNPVEQSESFLEAERIWQEQLAREADMQADEEQPPED